MVMAPSPRASRCSSAKASSAGRRRAFAKCGTSPSAGQPVCRSMARMPFGEKRGIAPETIDDEAHDFRRVGRVDHGLGADDLRDHAAAIDVADERHRHIGGLREAHIGDVALTQIDLRGAARSFDEDEIGLRLQPVEALEHRREQARLQALDIRAPWRSSGCGLAPRPARPSRFAASGARGSCRRKAGRRKLAPASAWARPISPPSSVTAALFDMFCGLNGRTESPRRVKARARPATISDLPTSDPVPWIIKAFAGINGLPLYGVDGDPRRAENSE